MELTIIHLLERFDLDLSHALAALEVIGQSQGQLAQVAKQSQSTVQEHLEKAKQIVKQLDGQSGGSTAERSDGLMRRKILRSF